MLHLDLVRLLVVCVGWCFAWSGLALISRTVEFHGTWMSLSLVEPSTFVLFLNLVLLFVILILGSLSFISSFIVFDTRTACWWVVTGSVVPDPLKLPSANRHLSWPAKLATDAIKTFITMMTFFEPHTDSYTGRYLARLERDDSPTSGYRAYPPLRRSHHRPFSHHIIPDAFTPVYSFLLLHQFCQFFHMAAISMIYRSEVPEYSSYEAFGDNQVGTVQQVSIWGLSCVTIQEDLLADDLLLRSL